ncbi:uncharacterized protein LOC130721063 [Lotus japonicus]|uniref:uncharacterized protein LOC130721063 n=1 Tax=Lotus japonicus TaxID=34305 RepID=UPI00258ACE2D|nr:uncharacterized protein LOC130721063 [Lotus japonicus]
MPPKRKAEPTATEAPPPAARVTRSSTKRAATASSVAPPPVKKAKGKGKGKKEKEEKPVVVDNVAADEIAEAEGDSSGEEVLEASDNKTIVVEHCKQCNSFKTRALLVKEGLEKSACGVTVIVNPQKPRRGCFEIRQEGGKKFISLLDMKRPFKPMKDLDMDKVIADIIDEISNTS